MEVIISICRRRVVKLTQLHNENVQTPINGKKAVTTVSSFFSIELLCKDEQDLYCKAEKDIYWLNEVQNL